MSQCRNCAAPLEAAFCPQCGQKNIELERPLTELLGEVVREAFDIDGRAARTIHTLFLRPGVLTSEFLAGHRRRYTPPFRLYLVFSVLFFVVAAWVAGRGMLLQEGQTLAADASQQARFLSDGLPRLMFVLLPVFALILKVAFRQRYYFDHIIHSLHLHSAVYVVLALMLPLEQAASDNWVLLLIQFALMGYMLAYCAISLRRVYGASWPVTCAKAAAIGLGYMMVLGVTFEAAVYLAMPDAGSLPILED